MGLVEKVASLVTGAGRRDAPVGTIHIVDPSPVNWLYINYNVVEELVRVDPAGAIEPAAMQGFRWADDRTLEVTVRAGERFPDGEALTAHTVKRSFDELMRWTAPHPPGTHFNLQPDTRCEVADEYTVRFHFPNPDGFGVGKLRALHVMSTRFWDEIGFGYRRNGNGEGHW